MNRVILIVLDSCGIGALPDASNYNDVGANTLAHTWNANGALSIPNLLKFGLGNIPDSGIPQEVNPVAAYGRAASRGKGKDTTNGHFELTGLILEKPMKVFGDSFPKRIIDELQRRIGREIIGNYPASGTEIIQVLGDEHVRTGKPIVYLSADSLMQIAMHEAVIPLEEQYRICSLARALMTGDDTVSRVICRPFIGSNGKYTRTENRKDFSIDPPGETLLDVLNNNGVDVVAIGKIEDIFNRRGISKVIHSRNNRQGILDSINALKQDKEGLYFINLNDFDMLYGHRRNPKGYGEALEYFDGYLPQIVEIMSGNDLLIITADHGCDPTFHGTDHTREYIPILVYSNGYECAGVNLGTRETFADIGQTIAEFFGVKIANGKSFLSEISENC